MNFSLNKAGPSIEKKSVLIFGDSASLNGVEPNQLDFSAFNLSMPCVSLYDFYSLTNHIDLKKIEPKFIILSMHVKRSTNQEQCLEGLSLRMNTYGWADLKHLIHEKSAIDFLNISGELEFYVKIILYKLYLHPSQLRSVNLREIYRLKTSNAAKKIYADLNKEKGKCDCSSPDEFPFDKFDDSYNKPFSMHSFDLVFLEKLINRLKKEDIKLVFVHPPYSNSYEKQLDQQFLKSHDSYFFNLEKKYDNFFYLQEIKFFENFYFHDSAHINREGAAIYSDWLNKKFPEILKKLNY